MKGSTGPRTKVCYFSGTGNSLAAARRLVAGLDGAELCSVSEMIRSHTELAAETMIVVFPVYMWGLPDIIRRFFGLLERGAVASLYAVATNGGLAGDPMRMIRKIVEKKGLRLASGFLVWMPENFIVRYDTWPDRLVRIAIRSSEKKLDKILSEIKTNRVGRYERSSPILNWWLSPLHARLMRMIFIEKKLRAKDLFWVNAACDGCGTCAGVCPSGNIDLEDGRPTWKDHCEICVACLHWCPRRAIQAGRATLKRKRYHHPSVSLSDMLIRPVHTPRRKSLIT